MKTDKRNLFTGLASILIALYQIVFSYDLSAQLKFSIPSLTVKPGDSLSIPIEMTGVSPDSGIFSIQFEISYDPIIISADSVIFNSSSPVISEWQKEFNLSEGNISCALAGSDSVLIDIIVANLIIIISESAIDGDSSALHFGNLYVNEGTPMASGQDGMVKVLIIGVEEPLTNSIPKSPSLEQNYPNPFNPVTTIEYSLPHSGDVSLIIYNLLGEEVADLVNEVQQAGFHHATWDAIKLSSGIYFYRLQFRQTTVEQTGDFAQVRKMMLLK